MQTTMKQSFYYKGSILRDILNWVYLKSLAVYIYEVLVLSAILDVTCTLQNELSELDCQRMSDELEVGQMKRQADEKLAAARALVEEMEKLRPTLDKLIFERDEEAALKEEAEHGRKHVEARLALLREEIVDTPVDQLKSEIEDNEVGDSCLCRTRKNNNTV